MRNNKWKMNRAGLFNFWYYNDEEIFHFSDGKLLLRGSNGSGKSVTMQSILPVLLDGKTSPDRLDPFGSKARKIEDYLLGEKDIVDRDERTGYLFLEYKRENTDQYITTGIGLQARRYKSLNFWGFILTDNRRIGKDFFLYEHEYHAGEKQKIPLSRRQLENRIGDGGHVVTKRGDYRNLVNKYIFGFENIEAYDELIKLLIQLRSPKLSKDFKPTVIYEILEASLPPLTDEDLRHLSDTIESMDQTKQQIEQLERERTALEKIVKRYDLYNQYRLANTAEQYLNTKRKVIETEKLKGKKLTEQNNLEATILQLEERKRALQQRKDVLEKRKQRLEKHKVWDLQEEKQSNENKLADLKEEIKRKDDRISEKTRQELNYKSQLEDLLLQVEQYEQEMEDQLIDLETDAQNCSFDRHEMNVADFLRNQQSDFDFTIWKKEAENHFKLLSNIREQLRTYEHTRDEIAELDKVIANRRLEIERTKHEQSDWEKIFDRDKLEKMNEIYRWHENHSFLPIESELLQSTARDMERLYEPITYESIRERFFQASRDFQLTINEQIAAKTNEEKLIREQIEEKERQLLDLLEKRDPDPPNFQEETKETRKRLKEAGVQYIPFYEAVEFLDGVELDVQKKLEAALIDSGLLNALIMKDHIAMEHDRMIKPNPQLMAHTLADYLQPDVDDDADVPAEKIMEVLQSILVADNGAKETIVVKTDGTYQLGLLEGHAVPVDKVRYIGRTARRRHREEQITLLNTEIEQLKDEAADVRLEISRLKEKIDAAKQAIENFPNDEDLLAAYKEIEKYRFQIKQLEEDLMERDKIMHEKMNFFQKLRRELNSATRELNIEFSYEAYQEAVDIQRRYEKDLNELEKLHVKFRHQHENKKRTEERLQELAEEIDDLKGEVNILSDEKERTEQNIEEIDKQIAQQGIDDIRSQIESVLKEMEATEHELGEIATNIPMKNADLRVLKEDLVDVEQKLQFYKVLVRAWSETFHDELKYKLVSVDEKKSADDIAKWAVDKWKHLINDAAKIREHLTKAYYEEHSNLMEYRMTEFYTPIPKFEVDTSNWRDEQHVLFDHWKEQATRQLIQLDFLGERLSPYTVQHRLEEDYLRQQKLLSEQDRQLFEDILLRSVGRKLRSRIYRAELWTKQMNKLMQESVSTSGINFSIQWKPKTAETEAELDTKELVELLRRNPELLRDDDVQKVINHFRSKINRAKELMELKGEGNTLLQVLKEVLDYRYWFSFVLYYQRVNEPKRELTNTAFDKFSGGEKAMAMYIPLFTACYSRYLEADPSAPYIISLDEAFAGVDDENINMMFRIVEELGFNYMMNSQFLWGDYDSVSSLSIYELLRPKNADYVSVIRYIWDGKKRTMLIDEEKESLLSQ